MSIFGLGTEKRFTSKMKIHDDGTSSFYKDSTDSNIGPGYYYDAKLEHKRSWKQHNPLTARPSDSRHERVILDRSHSYRAGVLLSSGLLLEGHRNSSVDIPGPGHYSPKYETLASNKEHRRGPVIGPTNRQLKSPRSGSSSPDKQSFHSTFIRDGLLVNIVGRDEAHLGPGAYHVPMSSFNKKSFNAKINQQMDHSYVMRSPRKKSNSPGSPNTHYEEDGNRSVLLRRHSFQGTPTHN